MSLAGVKIFFTIEVVSTIIGFLTGIIEFDNERKVIINEKILRVGEKEKGFTVADISVNQVLLTKNKHQVTPNLEQ